MVDVTAGEPAEDWRTVRTGVLIQEPAEIGDWLADTAAFDAAGADALWVDPGSASEWDVLALAAALAVVTYRSRLVVALPGASAPAATLARTLDTVARLSRGRLALLADAGDELTALAPGVRVFRRLPDEPGSFEGPGDDGSERWVSMPATPGRTAWRAARADAAANGVRGLVMPADPSLLDLLRNPDDPGGRRDLQLAQG